MKILKSLIFSVCVFVPSMLMAQRTEITLNRGWEFSRDGKSWQSVTVPHDWAINGPFDKKWDIQVVAIEQNGEKEATEKTGRSGSLPWIGEGHYRLNYNLKQKDYGRAILLFDGAMAEPIVKVNGREAGRWGYGYNAFQVDVTDFLHEGDNAITVDLNNMEESSRWYPGGGIFRPVKLIFTNKTSIDTWNSWFRTMTIDNGKANISLLTHIVGAAQAEDIEVETILIDANGTEVASAKTTLDGNSDAKASLTVENANLWSPEEPYLYILRTRVNSNNSILDETTQRVGIRTVRVSADGGFQLNGVSRKIKGVCLHHDLGPLGAAVNKAAIIRQIRTMKNMGCDAIRTSHNMPSTMQMEVCDSMGMMVMAESFDMWIYPKCKNGYARLFNEWAERDITNLVKNHRNHPSIVMWSIGNEIPEQWSEEGRQISIELQGLCHQLDPTRPVTQGMDRADDAIKSGVAQAMDVPGYNYRLPRYDDGYKQLPQGFILGSETTSTVSSRSTYYFPPEPNDHPQHSDGQCNGYDMEYCWWSNLPDDDWRMQEDRPWVIGEFVWTGYDYLGEPTPYDEYWPSRSSYFGICDLAGLPKDRFYLYRSHWQKNLSTLHLVPHWTWPGREGKVTPVYCYTSYPEAELFVNGKSQGRKKFDKSSRLDRFRLRWNDVVYEPGKIEVVAYDENGNKAESNSVLTAGKPYRIVLQADRSEIAAGCNDLSFITVSVVDKKGTVCPQATNEISFSVTGTGKFRAACNGDATSLVPFNSTTMPAFAGQLVTIVEGLTKGTVVLHASSRHLKSAEIEIQVK